MRSRATALQTAGSEFAVIYYVAVPFTPDESGLVPGQPVECPTEAAAIRRAEAHVPP